MRAISGRPYAVTARELRLQRAHDGAYALVSGRVGRSARARALFAAAALVRVARRRLGHRLEVMIDHLWW